MTTSSAAVAALSGLGFGLSLIVAIGAQNAFVLRQGVRGRHILPVVAVCALSDVVLIAAGVAGFGTVVESFPAVVTIARWAGAAFLVCYALFAARRAFGSSALQADLTGTSAALGASVLTCLALTWLNPHVYLDTLVLFGSFASTWAPSERWFLAAGAMLASVLWFFGLGYGASRLGPLFAKPLAWRILDSLIAVVMLALAIGLVLG
ncbi:MULTISPECIES: LysE/ArgO family amino acid transporter [Nocardia]|uniref:L-lysine exporter family protein LysE/ArgO n=2 Tax=Nocardia TaxID=1817 RepID=A0A4R6PJS0_NOCIG|nr:MULTISPECIES: LysE/ArgO family amino acid transporter [Nocardia]MCA2208826.1 LysE/ArgO family amino acid transporter [Nocardia rosealba]NKX90373.1 amino acid transporter [Nocardia coubleae]TDP38367.1 L-lysine exporter family protein LysE/ArgO [Nocardia ignorata]